MCTYNKVNTPPTLDIWLTVVPVESCVEPFKGLSCPGPLGQPVHPFGLMRVFFFAVFSAWIYAVVWQVNGAQQQTPCCDLQSDLIFAGGCYTDWIFGGVFAILALNWWLWTYKVCLISNDSITRWFSSSIELLQLTRHGAECLHVQFFFGGASRTARAITEWFARSQSMIFSPSVNWGGVFLSLPAFLYVMSNIYISLNFKCCQE